MIDLAELERLEKAATPGPWDKDAANVPFFSPTGHEAPETLTDEHRRGAANASLVPALRNAAPDLLAFVREACELLDSHGEIWVVENSEWTVIREWVKRRNALLARVKLG